jgi:hypothetical protein
MRTSLLRRRESRQHRLRLADDALDDLLGARDVVDDPTTWPLAMTPASTFPSTIVARRSMGVFAAMRTCDHDRSPVLRMALPP